MRYLYLIVFALMFSGCAMFRERALTDLAQARAIAQKYNDPAGERCWTYIESAINTEGILDEDIKGAATAVEVARVLRLQSPEIRKQVTAACGEIIMDVVIEIGKRARR